MSAWEAVREALEAARAAMDEEFSRLLDGLDPDLETLLAAVANEEQARCLAWAQSGLPLQRIIEGIIDGIAVATLSQPSAGSGGKPADREGGDPSTPGQQPHRRLPDDDDS